MLPTSCGGGTSIGFSGFSNSARAFSICALMEFVGRRTALEEDIVSERGGGGGTINCFAEKVEDEKGSGEMSEESKGEGGVRRGGGDTTEKGGGVRIGGGDGRSSAKESESGVFGGTGGRIDSSDLGGTGGNSLSGVLGGTGGRSGKKMHNKTRKIYTKIK